MSKPFSAALTEACDQRDDLVLLNRARVAGLLPELASTVIGGPPPVSSSSTTLLAAGQQRQGQHHDRRVEQDAAHAASR